MERRIKAYTDSLASSFFDTHLKDKLSAVDDESDQIEEVDYQLHHGIPAASISDLAQLAYQDPCHQNHPFTVTEPEIEGIYQRAF